MPFRFVSAIAAALTCVCAFAQEPAPAASEAVTLANFAYAVQLGSGLYQLGERQMLILRVPVSVDLRPESEQKWGLRGSVEIMGGFFDFNPENVLETGLPERIDSFSLMPGIQFRHHASRNWLVVPFAGAGATWNANHELDSWIVNAGIRAAKTIPLGSWNAIWGNELSWLRVAPRGDADSGSSVWIESCFEAHHRLGFSLGGGYDADYAPYVLVNIYSSQFQLLFARENIDRSSGTAEIGVTFGARPIRRFLGAEPRLGIGYRFGTRVSLVRIVFGVPVRSLDP